MDWLARRSPLATNPAYFIHGARSREEEDFADRAANQFGERNAESCGVRLRKIVIAFVETDLSADHVITFACLHCGSGLKPAAS